ncbi:Cys-tRNA(Pro) deacylase [Peptoniphilus obesi]|uniref:Cys-tRNA(Pro) deacylase n=1 Tax=Peptoniphilus obesi TaxID=1472765 RepID=UPI0004BAEFFB|nr:Cys-tRNA(Pro) deacylase [Peptoniphilus obesi]
MKKTNALRFLDQNKIDYEIVEYDPKDGVSGLDVARNTGENPENVYKTLVTVTKDKEHFVFVIPVLNELDLKKAAAELNIKKIDMLPQKDLLPLTGYVHGGCSPIGMKKEFPTYIDKSASGKEYIYVSAGKVGMQVKINPDNLVNLIKASYKDLAK